MNDFFYNTPVYVGALLIGILSIFGLVKGITSKKIGLISISLVGLGILIAVIQLMFGTEYYGGLLPDNFPLFSIVFYYTCIFIIAIYGLIKGIKEKLGSGEITLCIIGLVLSMIFGFFLAISAILMAI